MKVRARSVVRAALLLFVAVTCGLLVAKEFRRARELRATVNPARVAPAAAGAEVVVTYFHNTNRCPSCLRIEEFTAASMTESLAAEIAEGRIAWRVVNVDLPLNAHLRAPCQLMVDKITTVPKTKIGACVGRLDDKDSVRLNRAVLVFLGMAGAAAKD